MNETRPGPVPEGFQKVAFAFNILQAVPPSEADDGLNDLRKVCSQVIIEFLTATPSGIVTIGNYSVAK